MGIDQLALHSVQLGYLKILQMGNTDPKDTKVGEEIRDQASLSKKTVTKQNLSSREKKRFYQPQATVIQLRAILIQSQTTMKLKEKSVYQGEFRAVDDITAGSAEKN
ncbi:mitochondrial translocator assembly and maintenance protein 41 [Dorcoceras hygrometricum]|uniref:Mitochondrial translocator assembly and maintenance protein 41 n=1 Tax=Dorcoceras hygrometricum TaxID=472368 RepID=A0A2Z7BHJ7_9LAMI|nr:mitochondrial translocator assembly and maintenance protein 41 [Dorcoceras hygrometricum]